MKLTKKQKKELFKLIEKYLESIEVETTNRSIDLCKHQTGNCFPTQEEAQKHIDYNNAKDDYLEFIREWNGDRVIDWADGCQKKWLFSYNQANQTLHYDYTLHIRSLPDEWYILAKSNKDIREELIAKLGKDKVILAITGKKL